VTTRLRLTLAQRTRIEKGEFVRVHLPVSNVLVGRVEGTLKAYWNVCPHRLVPLDFGGLPPTSDVGNYLLCNQHGALFRREDGVCIEGPCVGDALTPVGIVADGDDLLVEEVRDPMEPR
jgi:nitrite reductase/ring-hydroxylating ferredoxin subunit